MSQVPPPQPPSSEDRFDPNNPYSNPNSANPYSADYQSVSQSKTSGMALASMIMGIISIPTGCVGIGIVLGLVALILGIVSLSAINRTPQALSGKGYAITGIVTGAIGGVIMIPLLIAILLPSLGKAGELSNRSVCAANLRGIAQSMAVYAADNTDVYPIVSKTGGYGLASAGSGSPAGTGDETLISMYKGTSSPSVPQNMWVLVLMGQVAPRQFLCKSDPGKMVAASATTGTMMYQTNFNDGGTGPSDFAYSYSMAYPWKATDGSIGEWWHSATDASLPILADMGALEGSGSPAATPGNGRSGKSGNSFNHQRDGQNVAFGDSHAEFFRVSNVGQSNDNIYAGSGGTPSEMGTPPTGRVPSIGNGGKAGAYDICLVPAADGNAGYMRK